MLYRLTKRRGRSCEHPRQSVELFNVKHWSARLHVHADATASAEIAYWPLCLVLPAPLCVPPVHMERSGSKRGVLVPGRNWGLKGLPGSLVA